MSLYTGPLLDPRTVEALAETINRIEGRHEELLAACKDLERLASAFLGYVSAGYLLCGIDQELLRQKLDRARQVMDETKRAF